MIRLTFATFLSAFAFCSSAATSENIAQSLYSWNGTKLPSISLEDPKVTIKKIIIDPGERLPIHLHPVINAGVLLSGKLTVYTEDQSQVLHLDADSDNKTIVEMVDKFHYGINEGTKPAEIIVFYISDKDQILTKLKPNTEGK
ncbi:cupin domain-containing protein [Vibrio atlanticus]|nr:cupin domain-containing protein [Vibrio atlanticus]